MKVLVACEFSGRVRDAFRRRGHRALSCDLLPSESPGPHFQGDVRRCLDELDWDLIIAHPPCTYLCQSGVRWLHERPERWDSLVEAVDFFRLFLDADAPRVAVENPIMHGYARDLLDGRRFDFSVQPWMFGDPERKRTCFWTRNLPPLRSTQVVEPTRSTVHNQWPGPDRWRIRSRTFPGLAEAMADQWGSLS